MFPYWIMFGVYAFGGVLTSGAATVRRGRNPLFLIAAAAVILWMGFRWETGGDWYNYLSLYSEYGEADVHNALTSARGDPGFGLLNLLFYKIGLGIWSVNLFSAIVLIWGLVVFSRNEPNPWLTICVAVPYLIIVVGMGYVRQGVAIGFLLVGMRAFEESRYVRFLVYAVLATSFHKSALLIVPLIALSEVRYKFSVYGLGLAVGSLLFAVFIDSFLDRLLTNYVESEMTSSGAGIRVAMDVVPAVIFLLFRKRFAASRQQLRLWTLFCVAALGCMLTYAFSPASTAVDRIALYLIPLQLFVLARLPYAFPSRTGPDKVLLFFVLLYSGAIQLVWLNYADNAHWWIPYKSYLTIQ